MARPCPWCPWPNTPDFSEGISHARLDPTPRADGWVDVAIAAHAQVTEINFRIIPAEVTQNRRDEGAPFLAVGRAGGKVFVQKTDLDGTKGYYSLPIVSVASPFGSLDDLLRAAPGTLNLGTGDPTSTSGFLISGYYAWAKNNIDIRKFFKNVVSANYEPILLAVAHKQVDVATNNTEDLARFQKNQPARAANVRIIWQSPIIPTDPAVWRRDPPDDLKFTVESFFLT